LSEQALCPGGVGGTGDEGYGQHFFRNGGKLLIPPGLRAGDLRERRQNIQSQWLAGKMLSGKKIELRLLAFGFWLSSFAA
jgi:hypothetical protein